MRRFLPAAAFTVVVLTSAGTALAQSTPPASPIEPVGTEANYPDVVASKLFFAPTGRSLNKGDVYFALDAFSIAVLRVGITDRLSVGVGRPLYWNTVWVTPKVQVHRSERTAVAAGVLHLFAPGFGTGGVGYGVTTIGSRDDAVTAGVGWFYGKDDDGRRRTAPVLIVGGERRMSRRSKFITENYVFDGGAVFSAGGRMIRHRTSIEVGGIFVFAGNGAMPGLVVNFVVHSKRTR